MGTTRYGITTPSDESENADIITFLDNMAGDVDTKFVPLVGNTTMTGSLGATKFTATSGGQTNASAVFATSSVSPYTIYDDNLKVDNTTGRRLWVDGPVGGDVIIKPRSGAYNLFRADATNIQLTGAVNITGTLNVSGQGMTKKVYNSAYNLPTTSLSAPYRYGLLTAATGFTFVAPKSGAVLIGFGALFSVSSQQVGLSYEVRLGATPGSGTLVIDDLGAPAPAGTEPSQQGIMANGFSTSTGSNAQFITLFNQYHLSPLSPGSTYNIRTFYRNHNAVTQRVLRISYVIQPDV